jgi:hypothetical protein
MTEYAGTEEKWIGEDGRMNYCPQCGRKFGTRRPEHGKLYLTGCCRSLIGTEIPRSFFRQFVYTHKEMQDGCARSVMRYFDVFVKDERRIHGYYSSRSHKVVQYG